MLAEFNIPEVEKVFDICNLLQLLQTPDTNDF
jgi:hypothetical protein